MNVKPEPHSFMVRIELRGRGQDRCLVGAQIRLKNSHAALGRADKASDKQPNIPQGVKTQPSMKEVTVMLRWHQTASQQLGQNLTCPGQIHASHTYLKIYQAITPLERQLQVKNWW